MVILRWQAPAGFVSVFATTITANIYMLRRTVLLTIAEEVIGKSLSQRDFPHLVCRPCVRRPTNVKMFQEMNRSSQAEFERREIFKRCIEISPSPHRPPNSKKR